MTDFYVTANVAHSPIGEDAPHEWPARRCVRADSALAAIRLADDLIGLDAHHDGMYVEIVSVECRALDAMDPDEAAEAVKACGYTGWMRREPEPPMPDGGPRGAEYSVSERNDIRNAGRGHLL